jgi:hypothetical protein
LESGRRIHAAAFAVEMWTLRISARRPTHRDENKLMNLIRSADAIVASSDMGCWQAHEGVHKLRFNVKVSNDRALDNWLRVSPWFFTGYHQF